MRNLKIFIAFCLTVLFIAACSQNSAPTNNATVVNAPVNKTAATPAATPDELASAKKIYSETCIKCHKADGTGGVTDIEGTKIKAPNFTTEHAKNEPDSEYIEIIEKGASEDGMPAYKGKISDADIKNLVKYIRREFQGK